MKVKEYRLLNGYTQTEIANILNIKQNSYSNKELGKRSFTIEEIKLLKELFEVTYEDLLN
ncbi:helix-turn-helix transcriptional regulator [Clostridium sp.]|uniref:helix-turn-helix transcriptional regulator n=1 Tax=Clostridium sp. TaxID=1506 RepID=UPI001B52077E|nr:helix-turn-helix transcriptional regulator [Clostridium sp.]MBP3915044.1 helix-turn-helix transcriptional regulator [Clostridium sp.]